MNYLMLDTETTNDIDCPLVYDIGFAVFDDNGNILDHYSFVVADIFLNKELMSSAFFAEKIPQYWEEIKSGDRTLARFYNIEKIFKMVCKSYEICGIVAHNARFDYIALQTTKRWLTKSKYRFFFPYGMQFLDTLKMCRKVFKNDENYHDFCIENAYLTANGQDRMTAEVVYKYLTNDNSFCEAHTGLQDCLIEKEIFEYCADRIEVEDGLLW